MSIKIGGYTHKYTPKREIEYKKFVDGIKKDGGELLNPSIGYSRYCKEGLENGQIPVARKEGKIYTLDGDLTVVRNGGGIELNKDGDYYEVPANVPRFDWLNGIQELLVCGVYENHYNRSEPNSPNITSSNISFDNHDWGFNDFNTSQVYSENGTQYNYQYLKLMKSGWYCFSVYVHMLSPTEPRIGTGFSDRSNDTDFCLVANNKIIDNYTIIRLNSGGYRVYGTYYIDEDNVDKSRVWGVTKYNTQSNNAFKVTGFQVNMGKYPMRYVPNHFEDRHIPQRIPSYVNNLIDYHNLNDMPPHKFLADGELDVNIEYETPSPNNKNEAVTYNKLDGNIKSFRSNIGAVYHGRTYTLSFWAKCDVGGLIVVDFNDDNITNVNVSTEWKKHDVVFDNVQVDSDYNFVDFNLYDQKSYSLWGLQLTEGSIPIGTLNKSGVIDNRVVNTIPNPEPSELVGSTNVQVLDNDWNIGLTKKYRLDNTNGTSTTGSYGTSSFGRVNTEVPMWVSFFVRRLDGQKPNVRFKDEEYSEGSRVSYLTPSYQQSVDYIDVFFSDSTSSADAQREFEMHHIKGGVWWCKMLFVATAGSENRKARFEKGVGNSPYPVEVGGLTITEEEHFCYLPSDGSKVNPDLVEIDGEYLPQGYYGNL